MLQTISMLGLAFRGGAYLGGGWGGLGGGTWVMGRGSAVIVVGLAAYWVGGSACPPCMYKNFEQ